MENLIENIVKCGKRIRYGIIDMNMTYHANDILNNLGIFEYKYKEWGISFDDFTIMIGNRDTINIYGKPSLNSCNLNTVKAFNEVYDRFRVIENDMIIVASNMDYLHNSIEFIDGRLVNTWIHCQPKLATSYIYDIILNVTKPCKDTYDKFILQFSE